MVDFGNVSTSNGFIYLVFLGSYLNILIVSSFEKEA